MSMTFGDIIRPGDVPAAITTAIDTMADGVTQIGEFDLYGNTQETIEVGNVKLLGRSTTEHIVLLRAERDGALADGESAYNNEASRCYISRQKG